MADIVLVNPRIGLYSKVFRPFIPLGLLAISSYLVQDGYRVTIIDQHMDSNWQRTLRKEVLQKPICVGITSMTGSPLNGAMLASRIVRDNGNVPIVWGGVHASIFPDQTLDNPFVDYVVRGEGEWAFFQLVKAIEQGRGFGDVPNLSYLRTGKVSHNPAGDFLDLDALPEVPYYLLDVRRYLHTYYYEPDVIEIETSRGCPYKCGFCYNKVFNKQVWRGRSAETMLRMMLKLMSDYGLQSILVIDDSFFIDVPRVNKLMNLILEQRIKMNLGFQGRLSGIMAMNDQELDNLVRAGTKFLQFGVESGSPRILKLINKMVTVDEVITTNRRLAKYPNLYCFYNFMVGLPTETKADVMMTVDLVWQLLKDNPNANIGTIHIYKEYPGTPLFDHALAEGYAPPESLEQWATYDWQSAVKRDKPADLLKLFKHITVASYCVDDKIRMLGDSKTAAFIARLYRPIARFRFRNKFFHFMPETRLFS